MSLRLEPEEYERLKQYIFERDDFKCRSCYYRNGLSVHHIVYRSQGGPDEDWNLVTLCTSCHNGIHVDMQDGVPGLTILQPANAEERLIFRRAEGWRPH